MQNHRIQWGSPEKAKQHILSQRMSHGCRIFACLKQRPALDLLPFFQFLCMQTSCFCFATGNTNTNNTCIVTLPPTEVALALFQAPVPGTTSETSTASTLPNPCGASRGPVTQGVRRWPQGPRPWPGNVKCSCHLSGKEDRNHTSDQSVQLLFY